MSMRTLLTCALLFAPAAARAGAEKGGETYALLMHAMRSMEARDYGDAVQKLTEVLVRDPENVVARQQIARLSARLTFNEARHDALSPEERTAIVNLAYQSLRKASPDQIESLVREARENERERNFILASRFYLQALSLPGLNLDTKYGIEKRFRKASLEVDAKINNLPEGLKGKYREAFTLMSVGEWHDSVETWMDCARGNPKDMELRKLLSLTEVKAMVSEINRLNEARAALDRQNFDEAKQIYRDILKRNPQSAEAQEGLKQLDAEAEAALRRERVAAMVEQAKQSIRQGRDMQALETLYAALKEDPTNPEVLETMKSVHSKNSGLRAAPPPAPEPARPADKPKAAEKTVQRDPGRAEKHYQRGLVYYGLRKFQEAETEWKAALRFDSSHQKAIRALGRVQSDLQAESRQ